ncbi:MAG: DUF6220 domain-containing protein [Nitrososphaerota archaeon]
MRTLISAPSEATQHASAVPVSTSAAATPSLPQPAITLTSVTRGHAARVYVVVARVLLVGVALQIFFAGLGIFTANGFLPHMILGPLVVLGSLALPLIAWRGHMETALAQRSWLIFALMIVQGLLIDVGRMIPLVAAFHPVNAMLLVLLVASVARLGSGR